MKKQLAAVALTFSLIATAPAQAHNDASELSTLSALPVASVAVGASAAVASVVAVPVILSTAGAVLVVKTVEVTARGVICVLERASDGARASVEIVGRGVGAVSLAAGTVVTVSVVGAGIVLSAAGEAIAFLPNALGRALLYNERLTY
jgi:hypothetical protein